VTWLFSQGLARDRLGGLGDGGFTPLDELSTGFSSQAAVCVVLAFDLCWGVEALGLLRWSSLSAVS